MVKNDFEIIDMFPTPVYKAKRDVDLDSIKQEEKEIKDIIKEGLDRNEFNSITVNTYIFNTKLKNIKARLQNRTQQLRVLGQICVSLVSNSITRQFSHPTVVSWQSGIPSRVLV